MNKLLVVMIALSIAHTIHAVCDYAAFSMKAYKNDKLVECSYNEKTNLWYTLYNIVIELGYHELHDSGIEFFLHLHKKNKAGQLHYINTYECSLAWDEYLVFVFNSGSDEEKDKLYLHIEVEKPY